MECSESLRLRVRGERERERAGRGREREKKEGREREQEEEESSRGRRERSENDQRHACRDTKKQNERTAFHLKVEGADVVDALGQLAEGHTVLLEPQNARQEALQRPIFVPLLQQPARGGKKESGGRGGRTACEESENKIDEATKLFSLLEQLADSELRRLGLQRVGLGRVSDKRDQEKRERERERGGVSWALSAPSSQASPCYQSAPRL